MPASGSLRVNLDKLLERPSTMSGARHWFEERQSAWLYRIMAETESGPERRAMFLLLARAAESQARIWAKNTAEPLRFVPTLRARLVARMIRAFGVSAMRPILAGMKIRGLSVYRSGLGFGLHRMPTEAGQHEATHRTLAGGTLRAAVFGINDGLVSNTGLVMGVAGAGIDARLALLTGLAGLLAGAFSMAAGEYVSMRSQRELYEYQLDIERGELALYPDEEAEELALIYAARGLGLTEARRISRQMMQDPERALDVLAREELGLNPQELGSPWGAAASSFVAFAAGAVIPLLPFAPMFALESAIRWSAVAAGLGLFLSGAAISLFTGRNALYGGVRMLLIGAAAGIATHAIGHYLGNR